MIELANIIDNPEKLQHTIMMWVSIAGLAVTMATAIAVISYRLGRMEERLDGVKQESGNFVRKDVWERVLVELEDIKQTLKSYLKNGN